VTPKKEPEASIDDLHDEWNSRALRLGVLVDRDLTPERSRAVSGKQPASALSSRVEVVVERTVSCFEAPFTRTQLITAVGTDLPFGAPIELIENQVGAVLSSLEEATDGEFPAGGRASPLHDRRHAVHYLSAAVARAIAVEAGLFAEALSESDLVGLGTKATAWPQNFALALISTATASPGAYATLRSLRQAAFEHARPLRLISSSTSSRSAFEAATGAEVPSLRLKPGRTTAAMTIVIDAWRLSVLERQRIFASATERGDLVVLCDPKTGPDFRSTERLRSSYSPLPPTRTTRRYEINDAAEVVVVDTLAEALVELGNLGTYYGESSRMLIDARLRPFVSGASTPDDQVRGATRGLSSESSAGVLLVLGGARTIRRVDHWRRRVHVVVAPPEGFAGDERALAFAMAGWTPALGRGASVSKGVSDRMAWGWTAAVRRDRSDVRTAHEVAPERVAIGGGERQLRDVRAEQQRGVVPRSVRDDIGWETTLAP
jgi:hypothetical protein